MTSLVAGLTLVAAQPGRLAAAGVAAGAALVAGLALVAELAGRLTGELGYGYKPLRAVAWLCALVIVGTLLFSSFDNHGSLPPIRKEHPQFAASVYTIDRMIPVVSLGLRDAFGPRDAAQAWAFAYALFGWALTIAVVAGLNAAVRRE